MEAKKRGRPPLPELDEQAVLEALRDVLVKDEQGPLFELIARRFGKGTRPRQVDKVLTRLGMRSRRAAASKLIEAAVKRG